MIGVAAEQQRIRELHATGMSLTPINSTKQLPVSPTINGAKTDTLIGNGAQHRLRLAIQSTASVTRRRFGTSALSQIRVGHHSSNRSLLRALVNIGYAVKWLKRYSVISIRVERLCAGSIPWLAKYGEGANNGTSLSAGSA